jgi:hypothetical protein
MTTTIAFDPFSTSQPQNSFLLETQGYVQGFAIDDPSSRGWLSGGTLDPTETIPMWGGVPITEYLNIWGTSGAEGLGPSLKRATSQANITGWSVFNQAGSMVVVSGNAVPIALSSSSGAGNFVAFYRNGANARIAVQLDPALVTTLAGVSAPGDYVTQPALYWDATAYRVTLTTAGNFALPTSARLVTIDKTANSKIVTWAASTATWGVGPAGLLLI